MDDDLQRDLDGLLNQGYHVQQLLELMKESIALEDQPTSHWAADLVLMRLTLVLSEGRPDEEVIRAIVALWQSNAKAGRPGQFGRG